MAVRILWVICILFFGISVVNCCSCASPPPKYQQFCNSNIVVLAYVYNDVIQPAGSSYKEYDALVYSVKRDKDGIIPNDDSGVFFVKIITGSDSGLCEVPIQIRNSYLFSASSLDDSQDPPSMRVFSCGWNTNTRWLSPWDLYGIDNWTCMSTSTLIPASFFPI